MNPKALEVLEYRKIIKLLAEQATSDMSRKIAEGLEPMTEAYDVSEALRSTAEAVDLVVHKGALPTEGLTDVSGIVSLASKGAVLSMKQLLMVHRNLSIAARARAFLKGELPEIPRILKLAELVVLHPKLEQEIDRCILSEDEMADNASSELSRIRRAIRRQNEAVRARLERMVQNSTNRMYLQDSIVTMRDGRYVIPVKMEHRSRFPGIVHDQSKGGATLFIEPQVIVDMNNELKELELSERAEVARILKKLSDRTGECAGDIRRNQEILSELDFWMAKAKLAQIMQAEEPQLDTYGVLEIWQGRHPLLDPKTVVPIDVSLGRGYTTLVVTGPNTGGKTLTLKTIGLFCMMALSGLHIPASSKSRIPLYREIFADIGDEQSIEQSLSTFSSHMKNIVGIVKDADTDTLVLLDELGAGTDPTEGAALGVAVLDELLKRGIPVCATTHYNEIKKYALSTEGVENASMEFDVETLSPTYRLLVGVPGRSNAFEISKKLGLPDRLIERAGRYVERGDAEFEDLIASIEADKRQAEKELAEAKAVSARIKAERDAFEKDRDKLEKDKEKLIADARRQARDIVKDAKDTVKDIQEELRQLSKVESLGKRTEGLAKGKRRLKQKEDEYSERIVRRVNSNPVRASELAKGDRVKVLSLEQNGEIVSLPDEKDELMVQVGALKMKVGLDDLVLINDGSKKAQKKTVSSRGAAAAFRRSGRVSLSIDVRGKNFDDARMDVEKYLDNAFLAGLEEVTVIHGRGEGILKTGLRKMMRANRHVASFRPGAYNEGGEGVTVVKLKRD